MNEPEPSSARIKIERPLQPDTGIGFFYGFLIFVSLIAVLLALCLLVAQWQNVNLFNLLAS